MKIKGTFKASSSVRTNTTGESVSIFKEEIADYKNGVSQEDLDFTKNAMIKSNARRFETQFSLLGMLQEMSTYNLPADVDYIKATNSSDDTTGAPNLVGGQLAPGGSAPPPDFQTAISDEITYVPTKITMSIQCIPIISRNQISSKFSLSEYAQGKLNQGSKRPGGGIW